MFGKWQASEFLPNAKLQVFLKHQRVTGDKCILCSVYLKSTPFCGFLFGFVVCLDRNSSGLGPFLVGSHLNAPCLACLGHRSLIRNHSWADAAANGLMSLGSLSLSAAAEAAG